MENDILKKRFEFLADEEEIENFRLYFFIWFFIIDNIHKI